MGQAEIFKAEYYEHYAGWAHREQNQWSVSIWASTETGEQYWQGAVLGDGGEFLLSVVWTPKEASPKPRT